LSIGGVFQSVSAKTELTRQTGSRQSDNFGRWMVARNGRQLMAGIPYDQMGGHIWFNG
jgi:hypothetical protein